MIMIKKNLIVYDKNFKRKKQLNKKRKNQHKDLMLMMMKKNNNRLHQQNRTYKTQLIRKFTIE